jgi:hypothetical protein
MVLARHSFSEEGSIFYVVDLPGLSKSKNTRLRQGYGAAGEQE